jgi:hypothetical protein
VTLGRSYKIDASKALSWLRAAQVAATTRDVDRYGDFNGATPEDRYRTVTVAGVKEKYTYVWHSIGELTLGAIFRQGTADVVARADLGLVGHCIVAAPSGPGM